MFDSVSDKIKFVLQTILALLFTSLAVFLSTYDFNALQSFNDFLAGNNFFAQLLKIFIGGKIDNNFFFRNLGLLSAMIAVCYVGYLAGKFLDDFRKVPGVLLSILFVVGIVGLCALKSYYQIEALAAENFEFNGRSMLWGCEFLVTIIITISAIAQCFGDGIGLYFLFAPVYAVGIVCMFIHPFVGLAVSIVLCVVVGKCEGIGGGYSGSYSDSYTSSDVSGEKRTYKRKNEDDDEEELTDIEWSTPLRGWDDDDAPSYSNYDDYEEPINWSSCYVNVIDEDGQEHELNTVTGRDSEGNKWEKDIWCDDEYHMVESADDDD